MGIEKSMIMRLALFALLLPSLSFAQVVQSWQIPAITAVMISIVIVALAYMFGWAFGVVELRTFAQDEIFQVIISGILIGLIISLMYFMDNQFAPALTVSINSTAQSTSLTNESLKVTNANIASLEGYSSSFQSLITGLGKVSSMSGYCTFMGEGYNIVSCGSLNSVRGPIATAFSAVSLALADLYAQRWLLTIAANTLPLVFLPLGLFLRSFKFTRGAGGALLAVFFGLYILFPTVVLFEQQFIYTVLASYPNLGASAFGVIQTSDTSSSIQYVGGSIGLACNPYGQEYGDVRNFVGGIVNESFYEPIIFRTIIWSVFMTAINLLVTLTAIRWAAAFLGAEIDVSGLVRIA